MGSRKHSLRAFDRSAACRLHGGDSSTVPEMRHPRRRDRFGSRAAPLDEGVESVYGDRDLCSHGNGRHGLYVALAPSCLLPRTTTGLAAGSTILQAIIHAGLEILERDAVAEAHRTPHFFDRSQIDGNSICVGLSAEILKRIAAAKLVVGIWRVPANHPLPVYWCHLMENDADQELVPLPAEGFGCDFTHDGALARALLEACQARLAAISGAREDITRRSYPRDYDREHLAEWRQYLASPARSTCLPEDAGPRPVGGAMLDLLLDGLEAAGAQAAIVVPLFRDEARIDVIRMVAPPLRHGRHSNVV